MEDFFFLWRRVWLTNVLTVSLMDFEVIFIMLENYDSGGCTFLV